MSVARSHAGSTLTFRGFLLDISSRQIAVHQGRFPTRQVSYYALQERHGRELWSQGTQGRPADKEAQRGSPGQGRVGGGWGEAGTSPRPWARPNQKEAGSGSLRSPGQFTQLQASPRLVPGPPAAQGASLTTLSSGTERLRVHSWLFTNESEKTEALGQGQGQGQGPDTHPSYPSSPTASVLSWAKARGQHGMGSQL